MKSKRKKQKPHLRLLPFIAIILLLLLIPISLLAISKMQEFRSSAKAKLLPESNGVDYQLQTSSRQTESIKVRLINEKLGEKSPFKHRTDKSQSSAFVAPDTFNFIKYWMDREGNGTDLSRAETFTSIGYVMYVLNSADQKIDRFTLDGEYLGSWGFDAPSQSVVSFTTDGESLFLLSYHDSKVKQYDLEGNFVEEWGETGTGPTQMYYPLDIKYSPTNKRFYIADFMNRRVQVYDNQGNHIQSISTFGYPFQTVVKEEKLYIHGGNLSIYSLEGEFQKTIAVTGVISMLYHDTFSDTLFIDNYDAIKEINKEDEVGATVIISGYEIEQANRIVGIVSDENNLLYALDAGHDMVKVFTKDPVSQPTYNQVTSMSLRTGESLKEWYENTMGEAIPSNLSYEWFSAWAVLPYQESLYFLLSHGRPAEMHGASLARVEINNRNTLDPSLVLVGNRHTPEGENLWYLEEDGAVDIDLFGNNMLIPGVDPAYFDSWTGGDAYIYSIDSNLITKVRCKTEQPQIDDCGPDNHVFPSTIHSFASTALDEKILFIGASELQNHPTYPTKGSIYKSMDSGVTWDKTADLPTNSYRIYDINAIQNTKAHRDSQVALFAKAYLGSLYVSTGSPESVGTEWLPFPNFSSHDRAKSIVVNNTYYAIDGSGTGLGIIKLDQAGGISTERKNFPVFSVGEGANAYRYNVLAASQNALFTVSDGGYVYKGDLNGENWQRIADLRGYSAVVSLSYWPNQDKLVAVTKGVDAQVLLIPTNTPRAGR